jgi:hypothetical protein
MMKHFSIYILILFLLIFCQIDAFAQNLDNISIHGFGGWAYSKTFNQNQYLMGTEDGNYDHVNFALNMSAMPYDVFRVYMQTSYHEDIDGDKIKLDYGFAELDFNWLDWENIDKMVFRAGKVKAPCMIYTEIYHVGTLRPFFTLPQGLYKHFAPESYKGVGISGIVSWKKWEVIYDLYGGKIKLHPFVDIALETYQDGGMQINAGQYVEYDWYADNVIGSRLVIGTPIDGLTLMASSYSGDVKVLYLGQNFDTEERYTMNGLSLEYLTDRWSVRAEYLNNHQGEIDEENTNTFQFNTGYLESAYRVTDHWQLAARFDVEDMEDTTQEEIDAVASLREHRELALGLNYWFNPNFVIKLSYHYVDGNIFAKPETAEKYLENLEEESYADETDMILIGTQFSF